MGTSVGLGQKGCKEGGGGAKISITKFAVNVHHYKYSIFKGEIRRKLNWLNTNKKHSNIDKELVLSYKATR